jgi:hypothetical protein
MTIVEKETKVNSLFDSIGKCINGLITLTSSDTQTSLVCVKKLKSINIDITVTNFKNDLVKYLNECKKDQTLIEFGKLLIQSNVQRRPGQDKWKEKNELFNCLLSDINKLIDVPYELVDLNFKAPKNTNLPRKKAVPIISGDRIANDTIILDKPEVNNEPIPKKITKKYTKPKTIDVKKTIESLKEDTKAINDIINKDDQKTIGSLNNKKFIIQVFELDKDTGKLNIVENLVTDNILIQKEEINHNGNIIKNLKLESHDIKNYID